MVAKRSEDVQDQELDVHKLRQRFGKEEEICSDEGGETQPRFASPIVCTNSRKKIARANQLSDMKCTFLSDGVLTCSGSNSTRLQCSPPEAKLSPRTMASAKVTGESTTNSTHGQGRHVSSQPRPLHGRAFRWSTAWHWFAATSW